MPFRLRTLTADHGDWAEGGSPWRYGAVPEMAELPYPRAMSARQVPSRIRARLAGAAAA